MGGGAYMWEEELMYERRGLHVGGGAYVRMRGGTHMWEEGLTCGRRAHIWEEGLTCGRRGLCMRGGGYVWEEGLMYERRGLPVGGACTPTLH